MRTPARVLAAALAFIVTFIAGSATAFADAPAGDGWPTGTPRSDLELLLLFGGGTVGLFVAISIFAVLTARRNYVLPSPGNEIQKVPDTTPAPH